MPHLDRPHLAALLVLGLAACVQPKERQVVQSDDPIEVGLTGQRERLLDKAAELEELGRTRAALTIYESLLALYPDDVDLRARRATARRAIEPERSLAEGHEGTPDRHETAAIDTGDDEHP